MYTIEGTEQELFDTVVTHLARQKRRSANEYGNCLYRGENSLRCAAGVLIPDSVYHSGMEGTSFRYLKDVSAGELQTLLISKLQSAHDISDTLGELKSKLYTIAAHHNLDPILVSTITEWIVDIP